MRSSAKRLQNIIEKDRLILSRDSAEMIRYDLREVLKEYFTLKSEITLSIERAEKGYKVTVTANADAIKSFGIIR